MRDSIIVGKQGRYKLIDKRGNGSMATVWIARELATNRLVAVKILNQDIANQDEILKRFEREALILMSLDNLHIVRTYDYGESNGLHYIVMDYVDGTTLKELQVAQTQLHPRQALELIHQAAEGLEAAYQSQVVHRDIKPQNILVNTANVVKLTDFGMARDDKASGTLTEADTFMGTPYYVAPEQANNAHEADIRADLYSLACVYFELLTGRVPYEGANAVDVVVKHIRQAIPSACELRPDLPQEVDRFLQQAMAKSPVSRFQTPQEFLRALEELGRNAGFAPLSRAPSQRNPGIAAVPFASAAPGPVAPVGSGPYGGTPQAPPVYPPAAPPPPPAPQAQFTILSTGRVIPVNTAETLIGRYDPQKHPTPPQVELSDLDPSRLIARSQARILLEQGRFFLVNGEPRNATRLNGEALQPNERRELHEADLLRIANVEIRFNLVPVGARERR
jgi:serine/threonine-protein kinase